MPTIKDIAELARDFALILMLVSACYATSQAQQQQSGFLKPYGTGFKVSTAIYWSGTAADLVSSRGLYGEQNPLVRNSNGSTSISRALIYSAIVYAPTVWLEKKSAKAAFWIRILAGGIKFVVAWHNGRIPR